jgi:AcrR family transcriptional regulator
VEQPRLAEAAARQRRENVALVIERVALGLFAERPMAKVTVEEVAGAANVALRTFYRYFPSKEHVFAGLPRRAAERLGAAIVERPPKEKPFQALRNAVADSGVELETEDLALWLQAYSLSDAQDRIAPMGLIASARAVAEALAQRTGLDPDDLWPTVAGDLVAMAMAAAARQWARDGGDFRALQLEALDIAGRGLARGPS